MEEQAQTIKGIELTEQTINEVLNYLSDKPFKEVAGLINKIITEVNNKNNN